MLALLALLITATGLIGLFVLASEAPGRFINLEEYVSLLAMPMEYVPQEYWETFRSEHPPYENLP